MSGYMDYLSSYYNIAGGNNNTSIYQVLNSALSGVGSKTGLESLNELSGQDDNNSFMSVLSSYMGNNFLNTNNNAVDSVVADRLGKALKTMDEGSEEYALVKEAYEYLAGKSLGTGVLGSVYRSKGTEASTSVSKPEAAGSNSMDLNVMNPEILMSSFESEIEEYIENSIETVLQ